MENLEIKKIFLVQQNINAATAAIDNYLDYIYNLKDEFLDDNGQLKEELERDSNAEGLLARASLNANKFEIIRKKLKEKNFNLSTEEIQYIGAAFLFTAKLMEIQSARLKEAANLADFLQKNLLDIKEAN